MTGNENVLMIFIGTTETLVVWMQFSLNSSSKRSNIILGTWRIKMINIYSELFMMLYLQLLNFKTDEREKC
uniref:Uncharacterized protein n=1 Tax=Oryza glumipatula TaxID=40148 RepID=A0A0D9YQ98_9ORYZ